MGAEEFDGKNDRASKKNGHFGIGDARLRELGW
jgi:hypothetical protein